MARAFYLLFGVLAYLVFFATFLYLIAFVGALPWVPRTVDAGGTIGPVPAAVAIDLALIALFGLQHSVMARQGFKRAWTRMIPEPIERSIYVLLASLVLILMFWFWAPIPALVWSVEAPWAVYALWALFGLGWLIVLLSTFLLNHFELFGLRQVWSHAGGRQIPPPVFRTPLFYQRVRHPL
jgi:protein-S-isoprenylcysteine O-methyltransferase Ste14